CTDLTAKGGASDLVQETFLGAFRDFDEFHGHSRSELLAWLRTILRNHLAVTRRRYRDTLKRKVSREISLGTPRAEPLGDGGPAAHENARHAVHPAGGDRSGARRAGPPARGLPSRGCLAPL